jgi:hypothetical protein
LSVQQTIKRIFEEAKVVSEWQAGKRNQTLTEKSKGSRAASIKLI